MNNASTNSETGAMGVIQKVNPFKSSPQLKKGASHAEMVDQKTLPEGKPSPGMFFGIVQRVNPFMSSAKTQLRKENSAGEGVAHQVTEKLPEDKQDKNEGKPTDSLHHHIPENLPECKQTYPLHLDSSSSDSLDDILLSDVPFSPTDYQTVWYADTSEHQPPEEDKIRTGENQLLHCDSSSSSDSLNDVIFNQTENPTVWYTDTGEVSSLATENSPPQENKKDIGNVDAQAAVRGGLVEIQTLETTAVPVTSKGSQLDNDNDVDILMDWWKTVEGWEIWNESNTFEEDEGEIAVVAVADRVFLAARLFVRLINQRGCPLQQRILELLSLADTADNFHRKTVTARVGGGVASVAGSITTITGLILAPFTMGTSLIVTAVGIGVATAGGVASASANITDTVHSKTDRKKVEKMIQDYQEEIKDIKECLEFLQVGMQTLETWDFDQYVESISKKHLNHNVKHVVKEGGRAGKALLINTENLISTVQVLNVAGGAAKAAQVISVTTGVMSGLFLALDVFFLAKDSIELNKGAKTEFAAKIRDVCKDLQSGLLELNRIKEQLQKTMDEVEEEEDEEQDD
ncbi:hypothetical protein DPEC_G00095200 [Dallia pectoralis]|uniref:Uncharacterized protein n=1 Tax=Dallia pectoralis TaxID=75939 RepID=A0ACC2GV21_DALPE|nr:hypothetical protein DPEC_G00095200 [Dallia pectoralis]